jgi:acetyl esterase/lipase
MKRLILLFLTILLTLPAAQAQTNTVCKRTEDVIYGRKFGMALTLDVFQPPKPNGIGIIFVVSGGWYSGHEAVRQDFYQAFLDRGYTIFAVVHGSQPKFTIPEVIQDMHRSVRFIRHNAAKYGVDPKKLGVIGASAGGHLSLTLGTQGRPGNKDAQDPVDRESSAVQCVACFFPPTDFLNYGKPGADGTGVNILENFKAAFGPESDSVEGRQRLGREISPIHYITSNMPPTLILHGNADTLVPFQQAETFVKHCQEAGVKIKLVVKEGQNHGWADLITKDMKVCADWFDENLQAVKK